MIVVKDGHGRKLHAAGEVEAVSSEKDSETTVVRCARWIFVDEMEDLGRVSDSLLAALNLKEGEFART